MAADIYIDNEDYVHAYETFWIKNLNCMFVRYQVSAPVMWDFDERQIVPEYCLVDEDAYDVPKSWEAL